MNLKAVAGNAIHAPHPANPKLPRCRSSVGATHYEHTHLKVTCKRCIAQLATLGQSPDDADQAPAGAIDADTRAELTSAAPQPTRPDTYAKMWVITEEAASPTSPPGMVAAVIVPTRAELQETLRDRFNVPQWRRDTRADEHQVQVWTEGGRRVTWAFKRPRLDQQRAAFLSELSDLLTLSDARGVLDAVRDRGVFLGRTQKWRDVCAWFGRQEATGRALEEIAYEGFRRLNHTRG